MYSKDDPPFEFVKILNKMVNEPITSDDDICTEMEIDAQLLKRFFGKYKGIIINLIAPLIVAIVAGVVLHFIGFF